MTYRNARRWMGKLRHTSLWLGLAGALALGPSVLLTSSDAQAQELTESRRVRIARRLAQSTVSVICGPATGSGFVIGPERWVITNHHVVQSSRMGVQVRFGSGTTMQARVIRMDPTHDLAILELVGRVTAPALELADSDSVEVGHTVLAFGSPFGLDGTLTEGIVSARRDVPDVGGGMARRLIQTDAPINPGNSGGPLVDRRGRVVGVNTAILSRTGGSHGIGFAVPANYVAQLIQSTRDQPRPAIAVAPTTSPNPGSAVVSQPATPNGPAFLGVRGRNFAGGGFAGVQIEQVEVGSPAQRAGLLGAADAPPELVARLNIPWTGHIITAVDGRPVRSVEDLAREVSTRRPGQSMEVTVTVGPGLLNGTRRLALAALPVVVTP